MASIQLLPPEKANPISPMGVGLIKASRGIRSVGIFVLGNLVKGYRGQLNFATVTQFCHEFASEDQ
jgi:hypothetical protein